VAIRAGDPASIFSSNFLCIVSGGAAGRFPGCVFPYFFGLPASRAAGRNLL
jgi:hypothetical protein